MSAKTTAKVKINGNEYSISGYEGEEYFQKIAAYVNSKIAEYDALENSKMRHPDEKAAMVQVNIADDYFKAKTLVEKLERDIALRDKEIYDLKHDLISNQIKTETAEASIKELEEENKKLLLNKARLEATLEETLLDGKPAKK